MIREMEENIELLSRAVEKEAQADAEKIMAEARTKAGRILQEAQEEADDTRKEILDRAKEEAERIRGQAIASAQLKTRTEQLERREKLLDVVFEKAQKQLPTIQQWTEYPQIAQQLLREALQHLGSEAAVIHADETTSHILEGKVLNDVGQSLNMNVQMGDPLQKGIGVIAETTNGRLQYDNTLTTRLNRMKNELRGPVYRILMGEKL